MIVERFTFPGGLRFELESEDPDAVAFFQGEYGWARGGANRPADLSLRWQPALWPRPRADETAHVHKLLARWCYRVELAAGRVELQARGNRWALPMVHHMLVHSALRFLAAGRGHLFLHAAALVREGRSVLLTGSGGVGKTTSSSLLLARGDAAWRYHADDYVIVAPERGISFAYPTRAHLYGDLLHWLPEINARLMAWERFGVRFFGALRQLTRRGITWPTRVELARLWPERRLEPEAELGGLFQLKRGPVERPELAPLHDVDTLVEELLAMNFGEARHFIALLEKAGGWRTRPDALERWHGQEREALQRLVRGVPCFRLTLPAEPGADLPAELERELLAALGQQVGRP